MSILLLMCSILSKRRVVLSAPFFVAWSLTIVLSQAFGARSITAIINPGPSQSWKNGGWTVGWLYCSLHNVSKTKQSVTAIPYATTVSVDINAANQLIAGAIRSADLLTDQYITWFWEYGVSGFPCCEVPSYWHIPSKIVFEVLQDRGAVEGSCTMDWTTPSSSRQFTNVSVNAGRAF